MADVDSVLTVRETVLTVALKLWALYWLVHGLIRAVLSTAQMQAREPSGLRALGELASISGVVHLLASVVLLWKGRTIARALLPRPEPSQRCRGLLEAALACVGTATFVVGLASLAGLLIHRVPPVDLEYGVPYTHAMRSALTTSALGGLAAVAPRLIARVRRNVEAR